MAKLGEIKPLEFEQSGFSPKEWKILKGLSSPQKIQNYLNLLPFNFEEEGETYMSVRRVIKAGKAHCFEGALLAAAALWVHGSRPFLLDLSTTKHDQDHVVALFVKDGMWGAISKTNHTVLRYREPIYRDIRELAMSYFHEYFLENGNKTLRSYSKPFDLSRAKINWLTGDEDLFDLVNELDRSPHTQILNRKQVKNLRKADKTETKLFDITQYKPKKKRKL
jgi:hypothetical protein